MLEALLLIASLGSPGVAGEVRVALLPTVAEGALDAAITARIDGQVEAGLARGGVAMVDAVAVAEATPGSCGDGICAREVAQGTGAQYVVRPRLVRRDRDFELELELFDANGKSVGRSRDVCEICGIEEVAELAADQAALLRGKLDALSRSPTALRIDSSPSGATVWIDGERVGTTPMLRELIPGAHVLRVERPGHVAEERKIVAAEGVEQALKLQLSALPADAGPTRRGRNLVTIGLATVAVGVLSTIGGAVLVALDDRQYRRRCSGDDVDVEGTCRFSYDTVAGGATALSLGLVATGAGIGMIVVGKRRDARVRVSAGPAGVGVHGRF